MVQGWGCHHLVYLAATWYAVRAALWSQGVVTPIHAMNPSATGVKVKSKGQHPFPGEVKRSWCFCSFSQMVKTESKVKIPSAELVASLITTD